MNKTNHVSHWIKLLIMLVVVIFLTSTISGCISTPTTPNLPLPIKPEKLKLYNLTDVELNILTSCTPEKANCLVTPKIMNKFHMKIILYRNYANELKAVITENNRYSD